MRVSEFWMLMEQEFGQGYAAIVADQRVLGSLDGRTVDQAIEDGEPVRRVWEAVVRDLEVPSEHHFLHEPNRD